MSAAGDAVRDIRREMPHLMDELGVNTADEHQVFHAVLAWLVSGVVKDAENAAAAEIPKVL